MKNITIGLAIAILAVAMTACAYAAEIAVGIPLMQTKGAICTTSGEASPAPGKAQAISVSAKVLSTVSVKLSATKIDWKVTSAGTYSHPAINIMVQNPNNHDVVMNVAGAADIARANGKKINTFYGLASNWKPYDLNRQDYDMTECPVNYEPTYQSAVNFNGSHKLSPSYMSTLWNKIVVDDRTPTGDYADQFTVTFSEQL